MKQNQWVLRLSASTTMHDCEDIRQQAANVPFDQRRFHLELVQLIQQSLNLSPLLAFSASCDKSAVGDDTSCGQRNPVPIPQLFTVRIATLLLFNSFRHVSPRNQSSVRRKENQPRMFIYVDVQHHCSPRPRDRQRHHESLRTKG